MSELNVELDLDIWRHGRNPEGIFNNKLLRASYPFVEVDYRDRTKIAKILEDNFETEPGSPAPYLHRLQFVFFQSKEDAHFFQGLLYVY